MLVLFNGTRSDYNSSLALPYCQKMAFNKASFAYSVRNAFSPRKLSYPKQSTFVVFFSDEELLLNKCCSSKPVVDLMAFNYQINIVQQRSTPVDFNVSMKQK